MARTNLEARSIASVIPCVVIPQFDSGCDPLSIRMLCRIIQMRLLEDLLSAISYFFTYFGGF